jgi:hypothetical protein
MAKRQEKVPPLGVRLAVDIEEYPGARASTFQARVRWVDPITRKREALKRSFESLDAARSWADRMERTARTGVDTGQTLKTFVDNIGDRWARGVDPTSTLDPYAAGLRLRVLPALGHLPVPMLTAGLIDRAIDVWEVEHGRSTVKNSVAALVLVLARQSAMV